MLESEDSDSDSEEEETTATKDPITNGTNGICVVQLIILFYYIEELCSVFVGNLSYDCDEESLKKLFIDGGFKPASVRIITSYDGQSRG